MGSTTSAPRQPDQPGQPPPEPEAPHNDGEHHDPEAEDPHAPKEPELKGGVVYDPETGKHFDPYTGEYVVTPGHYEPPPPPPRPLRVKVRKRDHVRLRKKRRPPKPERIPTTPPPPPPQPPVYYDENGDPLPPEYDEFGNLVEYDKDGNVIEKDDWGYYIDYDEYGEPMTPDYRYNEYGEIIPYDPYPQPPPPPKEPKYHYPDDGYDYDNDTYTFTTVESTPEPTPSPVSSDEVQEKEDSGDESMEDVDDFFWRPPPPDLPPRDDARALLKSGGEGCRCFPPRSDLGIPSMVYDQVTCPHNNSVIGHMHGAVYRFDENWDSYRARVRRPRRPNRHRSRVCVVWGYPNSERLSEGPGFEGGLRGEFRMPTRSPDQDGLSQSLSKRGGEGTAVGSRAGQGGSRGVRSVVDVPAPQPTSAAERAPSKPRTGDPAANPEAAVKKDQENDATEKPPSQPKPEVEKVNSAPKLSREKENKPELPKPDRAPARGSRATIIAERLLPRIGYTPEKKTRDHVSPSPQKQPERRAESPLQLPPIAAASTPGSMYSRSMMTASMEFGVRPDVNRERNFKGKYFDPTTNKTYTYDIRPNFGQRMDQWNAVRN